MSPAERDALYRHHEALRSGVPAFPDAPEDASEAWLGTLIVTELLALAGLPFPERDDPDAPPVARMLFLAAPDSAVTLVSPFGGALLRVDGPPTAESLRTALRAADGGPPHTPEHDGDPLPDDAPLLVVGAPNRLFRLHEAAEAAGLSLEPHTVFTDSPPLMPAAREFFEDTWDCALVQVLIHPEAGAVFASGFPDGSPRIRALRPPGSIAVLDRFDAPAPPDTLGTIRIDLPDGRRLALGSGGVVEAGPDEPEPGVFLLHGETERAPMRMPSGEPIDAMEQHGALSTLPVFSYRARRSAAGLVLHAAPAPGTEPEELKARLNHILAPLFPHRDIRIDAPGDEPEGPLLRVDDDARQSEVIALWAGSDGTDSNPDERDAWTAQLRQAGIEFGSGSEESTTFRIDTAPGRTWVQAWATRIGELLTELGLSAAAEGDPQVHVLVGDAPPPEHLPDADGRLFVVALERLGHGERALLGSRDPVAVSDVVLAIRKGIPRDSLRSTSLYGFQPECSTRPVLARAPKTGWSGPLHVDASACADLDPEGLDCPTGAITARAGLPVIDEERCIRCYLCAEHAPPGAIRPAANEQALLAGAALHRQAAWLGRLTAGKALPSPPHLHRAPPEPKARGAKGKPLVVLGLATVTLMEHAAALLVDGKLVAAIEQERLNRDRHYAWRSPEWPGASLASEPSLPLETPWAMDAVKTVLRMAGLSWEDVDAVALNGLPHRLRHDFSRDAYRRPPRILRHGSIWFVPHHLCHAASALGLSGFDDAWIMTCDGRGDYETLSWWRAEGNEIELQHAVPFVPDVSVGGVYETVTRILGFGSHGQGSTMALAAFGEPTFDLSDCMRVDPDGTAVFSEWTTDHRFAHLARERNAPTTPEHKNLAASLQAALEAAMLQYARNHLGDRRPERLCLAGGVSLNCRMNGVLRRSLGPTDMAVPPGANDAGTAIGAAVMAHREITGELPRIDPGHTYFGPSFSDDNIAARLTKLGLPFSRMSNVAEQAAELIENGKILCWFQGRMEFGPRALGARSILADPRRLELKDPMNTIKSRQSWRPFGPSILAGHEADWFEDPWDSRFMLFAVNVRPERRAEIPVAVHVDGSTRPQVVHEEHNPRYHALISAFHRRTGVPMVINTSFNRGGEPIVNTPTEAIKSFLGLGADYIVLGDCLVSRDDVRRHMARR